jgi:hypothetical protein
MTTTSGLRSGAAAGIAGASRTAAGGPAAGAPPGFPARIVRRTVGDLGGAAVLRPSYVMAPPPVSIRPTGPAPSGRAGPPVPEVARRTPLSGTGAATGPSQPSQPSPLFAAASALLRTVAPPTGGAPAPISDPERGHPMSDNLPDVRRSGQVAPFAGAAGAAGSDVFRPVRLPDTHVRSSAPSAGRELDDLVDLVVERIEQRVIDELERRGRRGNPGSF